VDLSIVRQLALIFAPELDFTHADLVGVRTVHFHAEIRHLFVHADFPHTFEVSPSADLRDDYAGNSVADGQHEGNDGCDRERHQKPRLVAMVRNPVVYQPRLRHLGCHVMPL
jgi:hypothetical protein